MDKNQIVQDLVHLVNEIDRLPMEESERVHLRRLVSQIETHVEAPDSVDRSEDLTATVDELITRFETDHPAFTGVLRRILNTLGSMGI